MPTHLPHSKTRCANLAEQQKSKQCQPVDVYSVDAKNRERDRNKRAICKTKSRANPPPETKTAAQAEPLNGGKIEKHSEAFTEVLYHGGVDPATLAARWYAENGATCPRPIVPALRRMFGLSAVEAVQAIRLANGVQR